ncbi:MAG: helix-turn-helix domain-containing protein [Clostridiales bacterium]|nr:helix-turn-helix domain-containing protein [Clostridiales bacterium]
MNNKTINIKQSTNKKTGRFYASNDIFSKNYGLTIYAKIVFCYLSRCADRRTAKCFPSRENIATNCSIGVTSVDKALKQLQACKLIKIQHEFRADNGSRCNTYTVLNYPILDR